MTDVYITWADGKTTVESFRSETEFYKYLDAMKADGYEIVEWQSYNPSWSF